VGCAGVMPPDAVNWDCYANNACYLQGTCAIIQNGGSVVTEMKDSNRELLENTLILPDFAGPKAQINYTNYEPWIASAGTKNPELVKDYLRFLYEPDRQLEITKLLGGAWFPVYKDHQKDPLYEDPYLQPFLLDSTRSRTGGYPGPNSAWVLEGSAQYVLKNMTSRILIDGVDIETAIDEAVTKLEGIRDSFQ
jgi:ABC-type glycerol-3-phosphate transport system substrate-binding protein